VDERLLGQFGHRHAARAGVEPRGVGLRAEHHDGPAVLLVRLEALEELLGVVEHRGRRVERERAIRLQLPVMPAAVGAPAQRDHVIGEGLAEPRCLQDSLALGGWDPSGGRVDLEVNLAASGHHDRFLPGGAAVFGRLRIYLAWEARKGRHAG